jgi:hypothetical protein
MIFKARYKADSTVEYQILTEHSDETGMYYPEGRSGGPYVTATDWVEPKKLGSLKRPCYNNTV